MVLSYSVMVVIEVLILVGAFVFLLLLGRNRKSLLFGRKKATLIGCFLLFGAAVLFIAPKIYITYDQEHTKLTADAWAHYLVMSSWSETEAFQNSFYQYYSQFPIAYSVQIMLHQLSGISLFESMTVYYFVVGMAGLLLIYGIGKEIISGSRTDKIVFAGIAGLVYSFVHYFNLLFVQQYPIALGMVAGLLCVFSFILLVKRRKRAFVYLTISGIILVISHPFAPIFLSLLFLVYFLTNKLPSFKLNPYRGLISRRVALFLSLAIIVGGMTYSIFVATGTFESGVRWSELNTKYTVQKLSTRFFESTVSGVGQSFEGRYGILDSIIYPLNWALPAAASISVLIFFLIRKLNVEEDAELHMLFPLSIISTFMFILAFAFSFVEFAFSRYFGAFALAFNIPVTSLLIFRMIRTKMVFVKYVAFGIMGIAMISSTTDPTFLPHVTDGTTVHRDAQIYPSELELVAWNDFFSSISTQQKIIWTNLHGAPIKYFIETENYNNEVVRNPKNYTLVEENRYLIIDKDEIELTTELQGNPLLDRVYDNSRIYFGH